MCAGRSVSLCRCSNRWLNALIPKGRISRHNADQIAVGKGHFSMSAETDRPRFTSGMMAPYYDHLYE